MGAEVVTETIAAAHRWLRAGEKVALATVIGTWGSAPRRIGAKMAVSASGEISGSVSGGCVEGAVAEAAVDVLRSGCAQLLHFGVADDIAWEVGLACGGAIDVIVLPFHGEVCDAFLNAADTPNVTLTVVRGSEESFGRQMLLDADGKQTGGLGFGLDKDAVVQARLALSEGRSRRVDLGHGTEIFLDVNRSPSTLVVVGGVHIAIPLVSMAKAIGFRTVVVDPRRSFGSVERFPDVDQLLHFWPDRALIEMQLDMTTAVAVLTHDPKLDDPALRVALPSASFYVGALGSRSTNTKRRERLIDSGVAAEHIERLRAPIGLDLGGRSPGEIALSVMAEIVEVQYQREVENK